MTIAEQIISRLEDSFEITRAELANSLGLKRENIRKALVRLLESGAVHRRIDDDGVEWLSIAEEEQDEEVDTILIIEEVTPEEEAEEEDDTITTTPEEATEVFEVVWQAGFEEGYADAWDEIGRAVAVKIRAYLGLDGD